MQLKKLKKESRKNSNKNMRDRKVLNLFDIPFIDKMTFLIDLRKFYQLFKTTSTTFGYQLLLIRYQIAARMLLV